LKFTKNTLGSSLLTILLFLYESKRKLSRVKFCSSNLIVYRFVFFLFPPTHSYVLDDNTKLLFTGTQLLKWLRLAAKMLGPDKLGFSPNQIGLHSARSGAAMAMYPAGVPVFRIMLPWRWSSDAFLHYIRKQVKEFSTGFSQKMIINEHFFHVPTASIDDPRNSQHPLNHASRQIHGINFKDAIIPLVSVFH